MKYYYSLIILIASYLLFIIGNLFSRRNYKLRFFNDYSYKNMFPFEFNYESKFVDNLLGNFFLVISFALNILFYTTFETSHTEGVAIFIFISGTLVSVLDCLLLFVSTKYFKSHLAIMTLAFALTFTLTSGTILLNLKYYLETKDIVNLIGLIFSSIVCLSSLLLIVNPKLSFKIKKQEVEDSNTHEVILKRPKLIWLAVTQWIIIATSFINQIGVLIFLISIR